MTTKEWLNRGRKLDEEINELIKEQEKAFTSATSSTCIMDGEKVQTSKKNTSESKFINYTAYSEMIDSWIDELYTIKREIIEAINKVEDSVLRTLLIKRYISFETWEQIAVEMNYSYMHICRLHGKSLEKIKDVIQCY